MALQICLCHRISSYGGVGFSLLLLLLSKMGGDLTRTLAIWISRSLSPFFLPVEGFEKEVDSLLRKLEAQKGL